MERATLIVPNVYVVVFPLRESIPVRHAVAHILANGSCNRPLLATFTQLQNAVVHVFDPCNPRPVLPKFFFVLGRHKSGKLVTVLVVSGNDVSLHLLWSSCRGFMRGVPVLASDSGYHPRSSMLPLARSSRRLNLRPQFAKKMPGILSLQRMVSHYSIEPCRITSRDSIAHHHIVRQFSRTVLTVRFVLGMRRLGQELPDPQCFRV
jgi:hypothetical protein